MKHFKIFMTVILAGCLALAFSAPAGAKNEKAKEMLKKEIEKADKESKKDAKEAKGDKKEDKKADAKQAKLVKENNKHAQRMAKIDRITKLGAEKKDKDLTAKAIMLRQKELTRHNKALERINKPEEKK
ncbi:MAG: hypothetical protein MUD12_11375 [Spirochaetes bacterium]|jgi:outer membrane PBP1 activator LpoA protein|nr:hypothetical protein [Spirochaetota bacterium]